MEDQKALYATILGVRDPWVVTDVQILPEDEQVLIRIGWRRDAPVHCPACGEVRPRHDHRRRKLRHLDTCQYQTFLEVDVPRTGCPEHGVKQIAFPWAEPGSLFTALFEAVTIDWLKEASFSAVARRLRLTWDQVDGIQARAVRRGMQRRSLEEITRIGVDETSFQKRHEYVTIVSDQVRSRVLYIADDRKKGALGGFFESLSIEQLERIEAVAMDMWKAYIRDTIAHLPDADSKICFDRFHVAKKLGEAVNDVRKQEHRELSSQGDNRLLRTKFAWLKSPENMSDELHARFEQLRDSNLKVSRAWAIKETARGLWGYVTRGWARRAWKKWLGWAMRSRLEPVKKAARMIRDHLWGILNAVALNVTNATSESLNAKIQWLKRTACGFRNRERFRNAIYFHCGGLDLYPSSAATHPRS